MKRVQYPYMYNVRADAMKLKTELNKIYLHMLLLQRIDTSFLCV